MNSNVLKPGFAALALAMGLTCICDTVRADSQLSIGTNIVVAPLTRAMWNQGRNYNRMCPYAPTAYPKCPDDRMYAGCTAVATAIVLDYYQWPLQGTGDTTYNETYWPADTINLRARFDQPYDWAAIQDEYGNVTSARSSMAIATLLSDVGAALNMNYGTSGSSTQFDQIQGVLGQHFFFDASYAPNIKTFDSAAHAMIQAQLRGGHPILCSGAANDQGTGHTYVCDGYALVLQENGTTNTIYHFNFGWGGSGNGWFPLDSVFTSAVPGESASKHPVDEMLLGVFPQREPQFVRRPQVTGPDLSVGWGIATCWTNELNGLVLERQTLQRTTVDTQIAPSEWAMHTMGEETCGWTVENGKMSARIYKWGNWGTYWPGMGNCIGCKRGVSISADTVITVTYKAAKLPSGLSFKLTQCSYDVGTGEWDDHDAQWNLRSLATLPCGSSSSLESKQAVIRGSDILGLLGGNNTEVHLAINIDNPNYVDPTIAGGTEIFRLESLVVSGEVEDWVTVEERKLPVEARSAQFTNLAEGKHRFVITAQYADGDAFRTSEQRISNTLRPPSIAAVETNANSVVFEVSDSTDFTYSFEKQSNSLKGSAANNGNRITYTFDRPLAQLGSHWLTLTVTDAASKLTSKYVHVTNPSVDHPLCPYTEPTLDAAVARARNEGKLVLLSVSGSPDSRNFLNMAGILSSNEVVSAIRDGYIVVEAITSTPSGRELAQRYWRTQPTTSYGTKSSFQPDLTAYAVVINPECAEVPYACDELPQSYMNANVRWNYFNSQLDMSNLNYDYYVKTATSDLARFLGQEKFVVTPAEPSILDAEWVGTIEKNEAGEYVVSTFANGVTVSIDNAGEHTIVVPPGVQGVLGVADGKLKVRQGDYDLTGIFALVFDAEYRYTALSLDGTRSVTIGGETIAVTPELAANGEVDDELGSVPFAVDASKAAVGVKAIPGLVYSLLRADSPDGFAENMDSVTNVTAIGTRVKLTDVERPTGKAFYKVRVSTP